jgi:hypothetical protein
MRVFYVLFFALTFQVSFAQTNIEVAYDNTPLKDVLKDIEKKTGTLFSYNEAYVIDKTITIPTEKISVEVLLKTLSEQTNLVFERLSEKQIIINKPDTTITICGYLYDEITRVSLPFASIIVDDTSQGGTSNEEGFFSVENVAVESTISIQYLGYKSLSFIAEELKGEPCEKLYLKTNSQALDDIIIKGYITTGLDKNNDGSTTINNRELGILPGQTEPDVLTSLQIIPGITSLDESASDIQIRGGSQDQNLVYFDAIKLYNTGHFFGMISAINPYIVEKTKIYKSGASPEYGDRVSGIIDISTSKKIADSTRIQLGLNGTHADVLLKTPITKSVGLAASFRRSYTDVLQTPTYDALSNKVFQNTRVATNMQGQIIEEDGEVLSVDSDNSFYFYDSNIKLIMEPSENDKITIGGLVTKNDLNFSAKEDDDTTSDQLKIENRGISILWSGTKFSKFKYELKGYYSYFDSFYNNTFAEELVIQEENIRKNTIEEYGLNANMSYEFIPNHTAKIGYQYSDTNVLFQLFRDDIENSNAPEDPDTRDFNQSRKDKNTLHSLYGEYIYKPIRKSFISLGLRASKYSVNNRLFIEPRLNVEYPIIPSLRVKATAERRYQTISQLVEFEDTQLRLENQIWTLSNNEDTPVLSSTQFSGGLIFDKNGFIVDVDVYSKRIDGLTSFTSGFTNASSEFSEGESTIFGVDVLLKKKIQDFDVWLSYTYNKITYIFEELAVNSFSGNNDIPHNFRASTSYKTGPWQFSLGWLYRTGSPFTAIDNFDVDDEAIVYGSINGERLTDYHRLDASLLYQLNFSRSTIKRCVLGVSFQNLYSRRVPISVFYRIDDNPSTGEAELNRIEQRSLGFTPNATLRFYF